ncbi:MAG: DUF2783 domain-containing protein [Pseudomonadota bacterium]
MTEDDLYALLLDAHRGLGEAESHALNARLVLLLLSDAADRARAADLIVKARDVAEDGSSTT